MWTSEIMLVLLKNWGYLLAFSSVLWACCWYLKNVSIIDRFWGPLCAASGPLTLMQLQVYTYQTILLAGLSTFWALRLAFYISLKNWNAGQDARYDDETSPSITRVRSPIGTLVFVFMGQATLAWLISAPIQMGQFYADTSSQGFSTVALIGVGIFLFGFLFEAIGDAQLKLFKNDPNNRGKIMDKGLWKWSRHPNYFGDSVVWFGLFVIALENLLGIYSIFGPVLMMYFLIKLTGADFTERVMLAKYPIYKEYMARTSKFFPMPPRKG